MDQIGSIDFKGKSGKSYEFDIYPFDSEWNEDAAVYVVTRRYKNQQEKLTHALIYVGETDNLKERFSNHHKASCFTENNANCLCIHLDTSESSRLEKEADILATRSPKCND